MCGLVRNQVGDVVWSWLAARESRTAAANRVAVRVGVGCSRPGLADFSDDVTDGASADVEQFGEGVLGTACAGRARVARTRSSFVIFCWKTPLRAPGRRCPPRRRWRCCSLRASWTRPTRSVIAASSSWVMPVRAESESSLDTLVRGGSASPRAMKSRSAGAVVKRGVVGAMVRACSVSGWRVSAIACPIE